MNIQDISYLNKFTKALSDRLFVERSGRIEFKNRDLTLNVNNVRFALLYIVSGTGTVCFVDHESYVNVGDSIIIPPYTDATIKSDEYAHLSVCFILFSGTDVNVLLRNIGASSKGVSIISGELSETVLDSFKNLFLERDSLSGSLSSCGYLEIIFSELIKCVGVKNSSVIEKRDSRIVEAVKYIEENYARGIGVTDIVEYVNLERTYFSRLFKDDTGLSPQSYLVELRLNKAAELILSGEGAEKVSSKVGYSDYNTFVKAFKTKFGVTPQKFTR